VLYQHSLFIPFVCIFATSISSLYYTDSNIVQILHLSAIDIQGKPITIHVRHYSQPTVTQVPPPPEPVTVEGEEEYEVDHIRDSKLFGHTLKYLVRWTGYGEGEDTWEPAKNLEHAQDKVLEFYSKNLGAPRKLAANLYTSLPWQNTTQFTEANVDIDP
jgi:hypothetical protein